MATTAGSSDEGTIQLAPGKLVTLSTRIEGGVQYLREDLDAEGPEEPGADDEEAEAQEPGAEGAATEREVTRWMTTKIVEDPVEFAEARKVRGRCRALITGACITTPFGFMICPTDRETVLDQRITEARAMAALFNSGAAHYRVRITPMRGEIASSAEEAVTALQEQVGSIMERLNAAIAAGEVGTIRDLCSQLSQNGKLIEAKSKARGALDRAVAAGRRIAREIKRAAEAGERVADVVERANRSPIAAARFFFAGASGTADEMDEPEAEGQAEDDAQGGDLPAVNAARYASLAGSQAERAAEDIVAALEIALETFGVASFDDRGPEEVMDLGALRDRLGELAAEEAAAALEAVCSYSTRGGALVGALMDVLRRGPVDRWLVLKKSAVLRAAYDGDEAPGAPGTEVKVRGLGAILSELKGGA